MINLDNAVCYDIETTVSAFTMNVQGLSSDLDVTFEISIYRDDRVALLAWFDYWARNQTMMIGYNSLFFDYPVIHFIREYPGCSVSDIYEKAQERIQDHTNFGIIWQSDRFAPQLDLMKMMHFDNHAKRTSLKALQFAMRSGNVMEMPLPFDQPMSADQVQNVLIPYNRHDVAETKKFALYNLDAIKFRLGLSETLRGDVLNFSDSKIGSKILEQRLGDDLCYTWESGRKEGRKTPRDRIALTEIIFPYVRFQHPEFNRVLSWMRQQTISEDEITGKLKTKGVFTGVCATVGGIEFHFGTGGIHGSISSQRVFADDDNAIIDIDVEGLYPRIAIVNRLAPEHLGECFVEEYAKLPQERKLHKKGTVENASFKLASNGTYGNSNNEHSVFYDPKFTMTITVNGQLLLCMLAEWLLEVPTLRILAINTDGITYRCRRDWLAHAEVIRAIWMRQTQFVLEETRYSRLWLRDVNSYIGETVDGKLKLKGAFWYPKKLPDDISLSSPPAWHKDFSNQVSIKAAVEHMVTGVDIERFIYGHRDPFDFMLRAKVDRSSRLMLGDQEQQRILRYYIATDGQPLRKVSPPVKGTRVGEFKRRSGITDTEYYGVLATLPPDTWDARIHTKNKSVHTIRETGIESGFLVRECNVAATFDFSKVNYQYYVDEAKKLVIK